MERVAFALLIFPIRPVFSETELFRARKQGPVAYFKAQALEIANLDLYNQFYRVGWTNEIAGMVKTRVAPQTARTIGIIWLLALLDAGQELAAQAHLEQEIEDTFEAA